MPPLQGAPRRTTSPPRRRCRPKRVPGSAGRGRAPGLPPLSTAGGGVVRQVIAATAVPTDVPTAPAASAARAATATAAAVAAPVAAPASESPCSHLRSRWAVVRAARAASPRPLAPVPLLALFPTAGLSRARVGRFLSAPRPPITFTLPAVCVHRRRAASPSPPLRGWHLPRFIDGFPLTLAPVRPCLPTCCHWRTHSRVAYPPSFLLPLPPSSWIRGFTGHPLWRRQM